MLTPHCLGIVLRLLQMTALLSCKFEFFLEWKFLVDITEHYAVMHIVTYLIYMHIYVYACVHVFDMSVSLLQSSNLLKTSDSQYSPQANSSLTQSPTHKFTQAAMMLAGPTTRRAVGGRESCFAQAMQGHALANTLHNCYQSTHFIGMDRANLYGHNIAYLFQVSVTASLSAIVNYFFGCALLAGYGDAITAHENQRPHS